MSRELLERCLKALSSSQDCGYFQPIIDDIKKELAKPEPEPVAWISKDTLKEFSKTRKIKDLTTRRFVTDRSYYNDNIPVYTHPQPDRKPLTEQQIMDLIPIIQNGWDIETLCKWMARTIERTHGIT